MANTKKTTSKPATKSKVISGGTNKVSNRKRVLLSILIVLVVALVGLVGFSAYKAQSLKAQAAGWTTLSTPNYKGYEIKACKVYTVYGYFVKVLYTRPYSTSAFTYTARTVRYGTTTTETKQGSAWWGGTVAALTVYAGDIYQPDSRLYASVALQMSGSPSGVINLTQLTDC